MDAECREDKFLVMEAAWNDFSEGVVIGRACVCLD